MPALQGFCKAQSLRPSATEPQTKMSIGGMAANAWDSVPLLSVAHEPSHTPPSPARDG